MNNGITFTTPTAINRRLDVDKIKDLDDVKRILDFINITVCIDKDTAPNGYEKVKDLFE